MRYTFTLRVEGPALDEIDADTAEDIAGVGAVDADGVLRWLGDFTNDAEETVNALLPEGWYCKVEGGQAQEALF